MRLGLPAAAVALAALSFAVTGTATASGVRLAYNDCKYQCDAAVEFTALPGERNVVTFSQFESGDVYDVIVKDEGAPLTAGTYCRAIDVHTADCPIHWGDVFPNGEVVRLGDGNDRVDLSRLGLGASVYGGTGDDVILGTSWKDHLAGEGGRDRLDGGGGRDVARYTARHARVRVDLGSTAPQGARGSRDVLRNVEDVDAVRSPNAVLIGDNRANGLYAGKGGRVHGGGGNDELYAGPKGRLYGGTGKDHLSGNAYVPGHARGNPPRVFDCGPGRDTVDEPRLTDLVRGSCETIALEGEGENRFVRLDDRLKPGASFAALRYGCEIEDGCPLSIRARLGSLHGPVVADRRLFLPYRRGRVTYSRYQLALNAFGERELWRRGRLRAVVFWQEGPYRSGVRYTPRKGFTTILRRRAARP
jgi:hypothetical protein